MEAALPGEELVHNCSVRDYCLEMMTDADNTRPLAKFPPMRWIRKTYDWVLGWSEHPQGEIALYFFAAIEAIFFPIPVDPILIAMGAGKPKRALRYAALTTIFSVAGACVGYYFGAYLWDTTREFFFSHVFAPEKFDLVMEQFRKNGMLAIFLAGFTPLPYKVFAIAAGVANISLPIFIIASLVGRSARFFLLGGLLYKFGPTIRKQIDIHFEKVTLVTAAVILLLFIVYKYAI